MEYYPQFTGQVVFVRVSECGSNLVWNLHVANLEVRKTCHHTLSCGVIIARRFLLRGSPVRPVAINLVKPSLFVLKYQIERNYLLSVAEVCVTSFAPLCTFL